MIKEERLNVIPHLQTQTTMVLRRQLFIEFIFYNLIINKHFIRY